MEPYAILGKRQQDSVLRSGQSLFANVRIPVRNGSGSSIAKGKLVYFSGYDATHKRFKIDLTDADDPTKQAVGVTDHAIANSTNSYILAEALIGGLDTSAFTAVGDPVFVSATAGAFTETAPSGASQFKQKVGSVKVKSSTVGVIHFQTMFTLEKVGNNFVQAGILSADATGRALMAADFFDTEATVDAKFAAGVIDGDILKAGALTADATGRAIMATALFDSATVDDKFVDGSIGEDLLTANELTGRAVANAADVGTTGSLPLVHRIAVASGANGDVDITLDHKSRVIDAHIVMSGAGTGGSTITIKSTADAISDAVDLSAAGDKDILRIAEIDNAFHEIPAAGVLRVTKASAGGDFPGADVYVTVLRVA